MAITSFGYGGTVEEAAWARMAPRLGVPYWVKDTTELVASIDTTRDRAISITPGEFGGVGIFDISDAVESIQFDQISSGVRYDMVVARRNWQGVSGRTSFEVIKGGRVMALPSYNRNPGVVDDHPLFLVELRAGQSRPAAVYDLRGYGANGKVIVSNKLAMDYYSDYPGLELQLGRRIFTVRGNRTWMRTGLEPFAPAGQVDAFNADFANPSYNLWRNNRPYWSNFTESYTQKRGQNAMGIKALSAGRFQITESGIYVINLSVFDDPKNPKSDGWVSIGLNTPDHPRNTHHLTAWHYNYESTVNTTQQINAGTIIRASGHSRFRDGKNRRFKLQFSFYMIG